jgi:hypothetical protein
MRALLEYLSLLALAVGFMAAIYGAVFCWTEAAKRPAAPGVTATAPATATAPTDLVSAAPTMSGQYAIAAAILTGALAVALAIYLKPSSKETE